MPGIGVFHKPDLEFETAKTASFTAAAGYIYPVTLTSVTADLAVTFPSSPSTDDRFAVVVSASHSSGGTSTFDQRPFFCVEPANGTSIGGSSYSAKSGDGGGLLSLWLAGEYLEFVYNGSTWILCGHNFIKHECSLKLITTNVTISNSVSPAPIGFNSSLVDNAVLHSATDDERVYYKREGKYIASVDIAWGSSSTGERYYTLTNTNMQNRYQAQSFSENSATSQFTATAATYSQLNASQTSGGNLDVLAGFTYLTIREQ